MRILLAEDEKQLNRVLTVAMTSQGYDVDSTCLLYTSPSPRDS